MAVEDSNDNVPYFTSTVYDAVAYESSPIGTSVLQVTALDKDNGINGQLTYTIQAGLPSSIIFYWSFVLPFCVVNCCLNSKLLFNALFTANKWSLIHQ